MIKQQLEFHLLKLGIKTNEMAWREHANQVSIPCPLSPWFHGKGTDKKPSLSIKYSATEHTVWKCFSCLEHGKLWSLFDSIAVLTKDESLRAYAKTLMESDTPTLDSLLSQACSNLDTYFEDQPLTSCLILDPAIMNNYPLAYDTVDGREYLESRGVDLQMTEFWEIRFDYRNNRIVFPVKNGDNKLIGAVGRSLDNNDPKRYYNYFNFRAGSSLGGVNRFTDAKNVAVVEGFFDLVKGYPVCQSLGIDICCSWHAELSPEQQNLLLGFDKNILLCYDMDEAGERGAAKALKALRNLIPIRRLKWKGDDDVAEMCKKDEKVWESILRNALDIKIIQSNW
jgi:hypothetical protein